MCMFPAKELIQERRKIVTLADRSGDPGMISACSQFVLRCDQLRLLHEEITGCACWYEALREPVTA